MTSPGRSPRRATPLDWRRGDPRRLAAIAMSLLLLLVLAAPRGHAVIIASGDGSANVDAPADDPGFAYVGDAGLSVVYLRNGWVVAAGHVPLTAVRLDGALYRGVEGSKRALRNPRLFLRPDLAVWKIHPMPHLPPLGIRATPPAPGDFVVLIGRGHNRGEAIVWNGLPGFRWGASRRIRWGTNQVAETGLDLSVKKTDRTRAFTTRFDPPDATAHEAHVAKGDSGGAAFIRNGEHWELAGVMFATQGYPGQPKDTALAGNTSLIADLSYYRDQLFELTSRASCNDGLDDDLDGQTDYPADPGCADASDNSENSSELPCDDGRDNDGDLGIDYPSDAGCSSTRDDSEE